MKIAILLILLFISQNLYADDTNHCPFLENENGAVIIGWITNYRTTIQSGDDSRSVKTRVGNFRPVAGIVGSKISETTGAAIKNDQTFWPVLDTAHPVKLTQVKSFWNKLGIDHCVYHGTIENTKLKNWTLLSSKPIDVFHKPSADEISFFNKLNTDCLKKGSEHEGNYTPPCTKGLLLAVSDIDKNGSPEYWATEPYTWDTGLTVYELKNNTLKPILRVCVGCSD
ncbi:hypothetical protein ACFL1N_02490 [Thermodesulfobacteriota bacterium]